MNDVIKPTIVVSAYDRPKSLKRLLGSIKSANYEKCAEITLIISIDGGGQNNVEICTIADEFQWNYGEKTVLKHEHNIGLREHIIFCGDLTQKYGSIILLEDDLFVSKNFYQYALLSLNYYKDEQQVAGISLYSFAYNENAAQLFDPVTDGYDVYFMQVPVSWGQVWTSTQWKEFKSFYVLHPTITDVDLLPDNVKAWPHTSWKKYFYKYIVDNDLYFVCPTHSYATNFGDVGVHYTESVNILQSSLEYHVDIKSIKFVRFDASFNKYDAFFEILPQSLRENGIEIDEDTCVDLYNTKDLSKIKNHYLLSSKGCVNPLMVFGDALQNGWNNILYRSKGASISYGLKESFLNDENEKRSTGMIFGCVLCEVMEQKMQNVESENNKIQGELCILKGDIQLKNDEIILMHSSKFWKLRERYIKIKFFVCLPIKFIKNILKK